MKRVKGVPLGVLVTLKYTMCEIWPESFKTFNKWTNTINRMWRGHMVHVILTKWMLWIAELSTAMRMLNSSSQSSTCSSRGDSESLQVALWGLFWNESIVSVLFDSLFIRLKPKVVLSWGPATQVGPPGSIRPQWLLAPRRLLANL